MPKGMFEDSNSDFGEKFESVLFPLQCQVPLSKTTWHSVLQSRLKFQEVCLLSLLQYIFTETDISLAPPRAVTCLSAEYSSFIKYSQRVLKDHLTRHRVQYYMHELGTQSGFFCSKKRVRSIFWEMMKIIHFWKRQSVTNKKIHDSICADGRHITYH